MSAGRVPSQATQATATLAGKLVSILALSGSSEHAGGASRVSFADPDRSVCRAPLGALVWALRATMRGALRSSDQIAGTGAARAVLADSLKE